MLWRAKGNLRRLRAALGQSLLIIGTFGARDGAGLPQTAPPDGGVDQTLAALEVPVVLLDLRRGSAAAIAWLDELRPFRANFTSQLDVRVGEAFDALVLFETLTPAHQIADR